MGNTTAALGKFLACFIQSQEWLGLRKPCREKPTSVKLQVSREGCIEYLKCCALGVRDGLLAMVPRLPLFSKDAALLQRAGFPMVHLPGNVSRQFTACYTDLYSVIAPGSC